tara:strand:- start:159 stop:347 length:189 start_codon:yes stop_codon:yes gene_type:complete
MKNKKAHFLYLVEKENGKKTELKLMTESEASDYVSSNDCRVQVWNIHSGFDLEPEMLDDNIL